MKNLRTIRKAKGYTAAELASKVGIAKLSIYRYEYGERTPSVETAYKIAKALGVELDELLGIEKKAG